MFVRVYPRETRWCSATCCRACEDTGGVSPRFAPLQLDPIQSQNAMFTGLRHGSALHAYVGSHGTAAPRLRWFKRQIAPYYQGRGSKNLFSLSD
jgi:hypothetical protein